MIGRRLIRKGVKRTRALVLTALLALGLLWPLNVSAQRLPDTGQTKCYDNTQEIPCPQPGEAFYGQDAQYDGPQMAYQDNGDGTVTDLNTGLMWQQGEEEYCMYCMRCSWQVAVDYCDELSLGGHSDWRLPTVQELSGLVDYSKPWPGPSWDTRFFPGCNDCYWTSSTYASYPDHVWYVCFTSGELQEYVKFINNYVRCVRGGQ